MNLPFFIAKRYFFSSKTRTAVNLISFISFVGITIGTAALVLLLSVFNGFENLLLSMYNTFDPHLKITATQGKTFDSKKVISVLEDHDNIYYYAEILEEKVLLKNKQQEYIATIKAVGKDFLTMSRLDSILVQGESLVNYEQENVALLGEGVAYYISAEIGDIFSPIQVFVPRRNQTNLLDPTTAFHASALLPVGVYRLGSEQDKKYIITPLSFLQKLLQKEEVSAVEIQLKQQEEMLSMQSVLQTELGEKYKVTNRLQQHAILHKLLSSEKLGVFLILAFMLIIATFNIIGSLSMLMIEKRKDIRTFRDLGFTHKSIQKIFFFHGMLVVIIGSLVGMFVGLLLVFLQKYFGFVSMGEGNFIISAYPVAVHYLDLLLVEITVFLIGLIASWYPVKILTKKLV